jgi:hypothetical protein
MNSSKEWLSLREASDMTGKSVNALRLLVNRKRFDMVKRIEENGRCYWLIHHDSLVKTCGKDQGNSNVCQEVVTRHDMVNTVTLEYLDGKQKEWLSERDQLQQGMMMYRYKFEEAERQLRLLPAPAEVVTKELQEKDAALARAQEILKRAKESYDTYKASMQQLKEKLAEEERVKAALRRELELERRPWWRKFFGVK